MFGEGLALLEEGVTEGFEISKAHIIPSYLSNCLMLMDPDVNPRPLLQRQAHLLPCSLSIHCPSLLSVATIL